MGTEDSRITIVTDKPWCRGMRQSLEKRLGCNVTLISSKSELCVEQLDRIRPDWIFVPHWNHIIAREVWEKWKVVIFHMTDLPYGRGGSPLQNLIIRGHEDTVISALRCNSTIDGGDIYLKHPLDLCGSAEEILLKASNVIENMICEIVKGDLKARPQVGEVTVFKRRTPVESNLGEIEAADIDAWYNYIRMMDCVGYPKAYLEINGIRIEFSRVTKKADGLQADVHISINKDDRSDLLGS